MGLHCSGRVSGLRTAGTTKSEGNARGGRICIRTADSKCRISCAYPKQPSVRVATGREYATTHVSARLRCVVWEKSSDLRQAQRGRKRRLRAEGRGWSEDRSIALKLDGRLLEEGGQGGMISRIWTWSNVNNGTTMLYRRLDPERRSRRDRMRLVCA